VYTASVEDAFKTDAVPSLTIKDEDKQQYVIINEEDMEPKDIIAQYDQPDDVKSGKNQQKK
jgi:hypothetical protein